MKKIWLFVLVGLVFLNVKMINKTDMIFSISLFTMYVWFMCGIGRLYRLRN